ncbi:MAG: hypothetical protein NTAFB01_36430 [Nitrospira sp.]
MSKYTWKLIGYDVLNPRSRGDDTNYITAKLFVNDQPIGAPQTKFMGDQGKGSYGNVDFTWAGVDVPDEISTTRVKLYYQIMNLGNMKQVDAEKMLTDIMAKKNPKSDSSMPTETPKEDEGGSSWLALIFAWFAERSIKALFADCDGPIGPLDGRTVVWESFELKGIPQGTPYEETVHEHGNDSPIGCGANSRYTVHFSTLRH